MTDEQIREVLIATQDYMLERLPKTEWNHVFSPKFRKNMKKLIQRDKHPVRFYLLRIAAIVFAVLGLTGGMVLGLSGKARADFMRWIVEQFTHNEFRYQKEAGESVEIGGYTLEGSVPEGYRLLDRMEFEDRISEAYVNDNGAMLFFTVMNSEYDGAFSVLSDESKPNGSAEINGTEADLYISSNAGEPNVIVWQGANGELFTIQGILDKKELIELAKRIN